VGSTHFIEMTQYRFSNCGVSGNRGPTQAVAASCYAETRVNVQIVGKGIQKWNVPLSGVFTIEAAGAAGGLSCSGYTNGKGAVIKNIFALQKGDVLYILVGQKGTFPDNNDWGGPGGGATFVAKKVSSGINLLSADSSYVEPLLVAAGGGGTGDCNSNGSPKNGGDGLCQTAESGAGSNSQGYGGAGFNVSTSDGSVKSFLSGGLGCSKSGHGGYSYGGFGSGGCSFDAAGGGGGYKGGNSNTAGLSGTGGYSFNSGSVVLCSSGLNNNHGYAIIELIRSLKDQVCSCKRSHNRVCLISLISLINPS